MLKTLIKKQCLELLQTCFIDRKTGKARDDKGLKSHFVLLALLVVGLGIAFYSVASNLGTQVLGKGCNWIYFAFMGLLSMALGLFGSVFSTYASLYLPKDNDLLLSMPIPVSYLLISRLFGVYITSLLYSAWVWIPSIIAYFVIVKPTVLWIVFPLIVLFFLALFITVLSSILGFVVAAVSKKITGKNYIKVIFSLAFLVLYFIGYSKVTNAMKELVENLGVVSNTIYSRLYYVYLLGSGADGNLLSMLLYIGINSLLAGICFIILSKTFIRLTGIKTASSKTKHTESRFVSVKPSKALLKRELLHFSSVPTWMLNGGLGLILMPAAAVAALIAIKPIQMLLENICCTNPMFVRSIPAILLALGFIFISTNVIMPVAVSMEGKNLYILQSLPLNAWDILKAKERMNYTLSIIPVTLFALICGIVFRIGIIETVLLLLTLCIYLCFITDFGLYLNLKNPNFTWTNAAYLTKQSMPVIVSMFGGWAFSAVIGVLGFVLCAILPAAVVLSFFCILLTGLFILLHGWVKKNATKIFQQL